MNVRVGITGIDPSGLYQKLDIELNETDFDTICKETHLTAESLVDKYSLMRYHCEKLICASALRLQIMSPEEAQRRVAAWRPRPTEEANG